MNIACGIFILIQFLLTGMFLSYWNFTNASIHILLIVIITMMLKIYNINIRRK
jgi:hypothetical protein